MSMLKKNAFTLAETLITLGIIGIVASITIPVLFSNYQKHEYVTGLKKVYSEFGSFFQQYLIEDGTEDLSKSHLFVEENGNADYSELDTAIRKYFKVSKVCMPSDYSCGITESFLASSSSPFTAFTTNYGYVFYTLDGMCIEIVPQEGTGTCVPDYTATGVMKGECFWISVDVNGKKPPNKLGRDYQIWFSVAPDAKLHPMYGHAYAEFYSYLDGDPDNWASSQYYWKIKPTYNCGKPNDPNIAGVSGNYCIARIMEESWEMTY